MPAVIPPVVIAAAAELFKEILLAVISRDYGRMRRAAADMAAGRIEKEAAERVMKANK